LQRNGTDNIADTTGGIDFRRTGIWLLVLLGVGFAVRFIGIGQQSIWADEGFSINYAKIYGALTVDGILDNAHGPLHAIVLHYWAALFGDSETSLRFPSLLISLATLPCFWLLARRRWGESVAWAGTILLTLSPFHIWYAQEARNYAFLMFFAVAAEYFYTVIVTDGPRLRRLIAYGLVVALGFHSNLSMLFLVVIHGMRLLWWGRFASPASPVGAPETLRPGLRMKIFAVWMVVVLSLLPWIVRFYQHQIQGSKLMTTESVAPEERHRAESSASPLIAPYTFYVFTGGYSLGPARHEMWDPGPMPAFKRYAGLVAPVMVLAGLVWICGLVAAWRRRESDGWDLLLWQLIPLAIVFLLAVRNVKVVNPRYLAIAFPAFIATLAHGIHLCRWSRIGVGLLGLTFLFCVGRCYAVERYHKVDYRNAISWLRENIEAGDGVVTVGDANIALRHYYLREEWDGGGDQGWQVLGHGRFRRGDFNRDYQRKVIDRWQEGQKIYAVIARNFKGKPVEDDLHSRSELVSTNHWHGVRIEGLVRKGDIDEQQ
jgi:4-amino-4-deoxy-L-arabinose transferase-like glycosyltransferase